MDREILMTPNLVGVALVKLRCWRMILPKTTEVSYVNRAPTHQVARTLVDFDTHRWAVWQLFPQLHPCPNGRLHGMTFSLFAFWVVAMRPIVGNLKKVTTMKTISEWLASLRAGDVMTGGVVCLRPSERLADAASLFLREQITGAPVVDDEGVCVGILSATDILSFEEKRAEQPVAAASQRQHCFDTWDPGSIGGASLEESATKSDRDLRRVLWNS